MTTQRFQWIATTAFALALFNTWVLFEETVIDRHGWWKRLPCYGRGVFCEWDVAAIVAILIVVAILQPSRRRT